MKWLWFLVSLRLGAQCLPVEGEFIVARLFTTTNPAFGELPPETPLGRSPMAGIRRVLPPEEVGRLAAAHGLRQGEYAGICFQWPLAPVDRERVLDAMRQSLTRKDVRLELLDLPRVPAPHGDLVFPATALKPAGNGAYSWVGFIRYGQDRHFPIRARVLVSAPGNRVMAREELRAGQAITAQQIGVEAGDFPLEELDAVTKAADVVGRVARKTIAPGTVLRRGDFAEPPLVTAGQTVEVEVRNGAMRLVASGQAEQSGRRGDVIQVRNPASGVRYRAMVERAGFVALVIASKANRERTGQRNP
jgi:flagella basal body P-ring formation protein FlgA